MSGGIYEMCPKIFGYFKPCKAEGEKIDKNNE